MHPVMATIKGDLRRLFPPAKILSIVAGSAILSFGLHNIHQQSGITEGGILGLILFLGHWFGIPAFIATPILDALCYALGYRFLGKDFLKVSVAATLCATAFFRLWELFPFMLPDMTAWPLAAAVAGGLFVGVGVGLIVRQGASSCGDDALAMVIAKLTGCKLSRAYLATDLSVLLLSLTYIPFGRIAYSLITVTISSFLIDFVQNFRLKKHDAEAKEEQSGSVKPQPGPAPTADGGKP